MQNSVAVEVFVSDTVPVNLMELSDNAVCLSITLEGLANTLRVFGDRQELTNLCERVLELLEETPSTAEMVAYNAL